MERNPETKVDGGGAAALLVQSLGHVSFLGASEHWTFKLLTNKNGTVPCSEFLLVQKASGIVHIKNKHGLGFNLYVVVSLN